MGTSPHVVDPINPGAVDSIIHLGDYWNEEGIRANKSALISNNERIKAVFDRAYNYLGAAGKMYDNLSTTYDSAFDHAGLYKLAAEIIGKELAQKDISSRQGVMKKYFASAITPNGCAHYLNTLIKGYRKIYVIQSKVGVSSEKLLNILLEGAVCRGIDAEAYYCALKPASKPEHLMLPELGLAFVTSNAYHAADVSASDAEIVPIDFSKLILHDSIRYLEPVLEDSTSKLDEMLNQAVNCLKLAKKEHDELEKYYIPNMDFAKIDQLRQELIKKFC